MANNYCQFSERIECTSKEQADWLVNKLHDDDQEYSCSTEIDDNDVIVYTDESGSLEAVAGVVAEFQIQFKIKTPWVGSYCYFCDKPRVGEFGGGAVVVRRGKQYWFDATEMANAKAQKFA